VTLSRPKEPLFFEAEFERGIEYYWHTYFAHWDGESAIGEARAAKLFLPYVAARIRATLPDAKLIVILRNPVDRFFSHWWMRYCNGKETRDLKTVLSQNLNAIRDGRTLDGEIGRTTWRDYSSLENGAVPFYLEIGYYARHLRTYLELFPPSQLKILFFDDLCQQPAQLFADVYNYLEVSADVSLPASIKFNSAPTRTALALHKLDRLFNVPTRLPASVRSSLKSVVALFGSAPRMDRETRAWLAEHYFEHNRQLEQLTGRDLSHWDRVADSPSADSL
jgi:hypothetical protein